MPPTRKKQTFQKSHSDEELGEIYKTDSDLLISGLILPLGKCGIFGVEYTVCVFKCGVIGKKMLCLNRGFHIN